MDFPYEGQRRDRKKKRKMKRRPTFSKSTAQRIHAKRSFQKRLGVKLTPELRRELVDKILSKRADLVYKQSNRVSIFDVDHEIKGKQKVLRLVFDKMRKNIITTLNNLPNPTNAKHEFSLRGIPDYEEDSDELKHNDVQRKSK